MNQWLRDMQKLREKAERLAEDIKEIEERIKKEGNDRDAFLYSSRALWLVYGLWNSKEYDTISDHVTAVHNEMKPPP